MSEKILIDQLMQLFEGAVWDGDLISKDARDSLCKNSLVMQTKTGYNVITVYGVDYLVEEGFVK